MDRFPMIPLPVDFVRQHAETFLNELQAKGWDYFNTHSAEIAGALSYHVEALLAATAPTVDEVAA